MIPAKTNKQHEFWLVNISNKSVSIPDLNYYIKPYQKVNLLSKHFDLTLEQLQQSAKDGSIYKKSNILKVVEHVPVMITPEPGIYTATRTNRNFLRINKPIILANKKKYEELEIDDGPKLSKTEEQQIADDIDISIDDNRPLIPVDKSFSEDDREKLTIETYYDDIEFE